MTREEAIKVARIAMSADDGCPSCTRELVRKLASAFPDHNWLALTIEIDSHLDPEWLAGDGDG